MRQMRKGSISIFFLLVLPLFLPVAESDEHKLVHVSVMTSWNDYSSRQSLRRSWLSFGGNWSYSFLLGRPASSSESFMRVNKEKEQYNDIIVGKFVDSYYNLTRKAVMMLSLYKKADYLFKADTDSYVNIPQLFRYLKFNERKSRPVDYAGRLVHNLLPIRDPDARWYVPRSFWAYDTQPFPTFAQGQGYVVSSSMAKCMLETAHRFPEKDLGFPLEDVFVGLLANKCGAVPRHLVSLAQVVKQRSHRKSNFENYHKVFSKDWIICHRKTDGEILAKLLEE